MQYISPVRYCFNGLMKAQWPLRNQGKYGEITVTQSGEINETVGTLISFGGCVGGLFTLWILFRALTVVSLTLQDKAYQCQDPHDTRNIDLKNAVQRQQVTINE